MSLFDSMNRSGGTPTAPTTTPDARERFRQHVQLAGYDDQFIDRAEERALLEKGIEAGLDFETAQQVIGEVAEERNFAVERLVEMRVIQALEKAASDRRGLERREFDEVLQTMVADCRGARSVEQCTQRIKALVLEKGLKVKEGGVFGSNWFSNL